MPLWPVCYGCEHFAGAIGFSLSGPVNMTDNLDARKEADLFAQPGKKISLAGCSAYGRFFHYIKSTLLYGSEGELYILFIHCRGEYQDRGRVCAIMVSVACRPSMSGIRISMMMMSGLSASSARLPQSRLPLRRQRSCLRLSAKHRGEQFLPVWNHQPAKFVSFPILSMIQLYQAAYPVQKRP